MPTLMEVLEYLDDTGSIMVARVPPDGEVEIKWGAQLTVRESQVAIFFRDGKSLVVFDKPGRYVLKTQNIPVLTKLVTGFGYGPTSPFRSEVYFLSMKLFRNLKWGTPEPIIFRDPELQMIRLRSYGMFSVQIARPEVFLNKIVGTQGLFADNDIHDYLRNIITSRLIDMFGSHLKNIFDLPKQYDELSATAKAVLSEDFTAAGLRIVDFFINAITPPDEVQAVIDEKTSMQALGDLNKYIQFKTAQSIQDAAKQPNGAAGTGVGLGAGIGMGMMVPEMLKRALSEPPANGDVFCNLEKLKKLLEDGIITQAEFDKKKEEILKRI
jgi:membrane protease subunit (stomatin/prohibitin family)